MEVVNFLTVSLGTMLCDLIQKCVIRQPIVSAIFLYKGIVYVVHGVLLWELGGNGIGIRGGTGKAL